MGWNNILLGGYWNAHSDRWNPECPPKRDEVFLRNLMDEYDLTDVTDGEATHTSTRNGEISRLLIDFFITKAGMADSLEIATDLATTSDHAILCTHLRWDKREGVKVLRKVTGWDIDGLKSEEEKENYEKAKKIWKDKSSERPVLTEKSSGEDLQKEAEWIQRNFVNHLNRCCKKVKVCTRSKRWWIEEIAENRRILESLKRARRKGEATQRQVKKQRSNVRRIIRQSKTKMWQDFLSSATKDQVWQAFRYTKPGGQQTTKALKSRDGVVAESWEDTKTELIKEEVFPKPLKGVERKAQEEGGEMWKTITDEDIRLALFGQSVKKAPGPDRLGFKAIRSLWEWDAPRIIAIVKMSFRLGIHPRV
jgi:hypothetical protein